jgi:5-methyltetrahydrofolate--homocysteine methyltransferase
MSGELANLLCDLKEAEALKFVSKALETGADPMDLLGQARQGMDMVGQRFAEDTYFIPELIFSGEILKEIVKLLEPHLKQGEAGSNLGKVIIGTVAGDIHDIGKDLVVLMLDVAGFEVIDLGIDVPIDRFVETIRQSGSQVVGLSGFLTLAYDSMKATIDVIRESGLRDQVKIMIGGGQVDDSVRAYTGADAYGKDAVAAVKLAQGWIGG